MKEYKVVASFYKVYTPRAHRNKVFPTLELAEECFDDAYHYYSSYPYLKSIKIVEREITDWRECEETDKILFFEAGEEGSEGD